MRVCVCVCDFASAKSKCNAFHLIHLIHSPTPLIPTHAVGITLARVDFCTLANNACSSKREHIPHKNYTK